MASDQANVAWITILIVPNTLCTAFCNHIIALVNSKIYQVLKAQKYCPVPFYERPCAGMLQTL